MLKSKIDRINWICESAIICVLVSGTPSLVLIRQGQETHSSPWDATAMR